MFEFYTTNFVGNNHSECLYLLAFAAVDDEFEEISSNIDLFPEKVTNMQGKEVVLAIFNYLPYVLWKEVVSIANQFKLRALIIFVQEETSDGKNSFESLEKTPLHIDGTESWVFLEFCKKLNCSLLISLGKFLWDIGICLQFLIQPRWSRWMGGNPGKSNRKRNSRSCCRETSWRDYNIFFYLKTLFCYNFFGIVSYLSLFLFEIFHFLKIFKVFKLFKNKFNFFYFF